MVEKNVLFENLVGWVAQGPAGKEDDAGWGAGDIKCLHFWALPQLGAQALPPAARSGPCPVAGSVGGLRAPHSSVPTLLLSLQL